MRKEAMKSPAAVDVTVADTASVGDTVNCRANLWYRRDDRSGAPTGPLAVGGADGVDGALLDKDDEAATIVLDALDEAEAALGVAALYPRSMITALRLGDSADDGVIEDGENEEAADDSLPINDVADDDGCAKAALE